MPGGYVSPEEYISTPREVRLSESFRARVDKSRRYWPSKVPASTFSQS